MTLRVDTLIVKVVAACPDVLASRGEWLTGRPREIEEGVAKNISKGEAIAAYEFLPFDQTVEFFEIVARHYRDFGEHCARVEFEARSLSHRIASPIFPCPDPEGTSRAPRVAPRL